MKKQLSMILVLFLSVYGGASMANQTTNVQAITQEPKIEKRHGIRQFIRKHKLAVLLTTITGIAGASYCVYNSEKLQNILRIKEWIAKWRRGGAKDRYDVIKAIFSDRWNKFKEKPRVKRASSWSKARRARLKLRLENWLERHFPMSDSNPQI